MKLDEFQICFDNQRGVFCAGENVSGNVVVKLTKPMKMRCKDNILVKLIMLSQNLVSF